MTACTYQCLYNMFGIYGHVCYEYIDCLCCEIHVWIIVSVNVCDLVYKCKYVYLLVCMCKEVPCLSVV